LEEQTMKKTIVTLFCLALVPTAIAVAAQTDLEIHNPIILRNVSQIYLDFL